MPSPGEFRLKLNLAPGASLGPGKADLLELIAETGSIAAAAKRMKMSWRRAWLLVQELNAMFDEALVNAARGGRAGGKSALTAAGQDVLARYRRVEAACLAASRADRAALKRRAGGRRR